MSTRRTARTTEKNARKALLDAIEATGSIRRACRAAGIPRSTVYEWRDRDEKFRDELADAAQAGVEHAEAVLQLRALSGEDTTALIFFLKCRKSDVYGERPKAEQIDAIRAEARREIIAEMQRELAELTPQARKLLMRAVPAA